jgi:hypothetical protein
MILHNTDELANTRAKLREIQSRYDELRRDECEDPHVRKLTLLSLKRLINQLTEDIARFESRQHRG